MQFSNSFSFASTSSNISFIHNKTSSLRFSKLLMFSKPTLLIEPSSKSLMLSQYLFTPFDLPTQLKIIAFSTHFYLDLHRWLYFLMRVKSSFFVGLPLSLLSVCRSIWLIMLASSLTSFSSCFSDIFSLINPLLKI